MSLANCSVPIAWPRTFDHASIHWSMNCFHCGRSPGVAGVWAKSFAQVSSPWSNTGRQRAAGQLDVLLLLAADDVDERPHARGRGDVVFPGADDEDRTGDVLEAHRAAAHDELASVELVLLIEVADPLPEELPRESDVLVRPPVERLEAFHVLVVPEVPPEVEVRGQVHGRLDELEPGLHQVGRDAAERVDEAVA